MEELRRAADNLPLEPEELRGLYERIDAAEALLSLEPEELAKVEQKVKCF